MTESMPQVLTVGRVSVDLYAQQTGVSATHVRSFEKSIGGTSTQVPSTDTCSPPTSSWSSSVSAPASVW